MVAEWRSLIGDQRRAPPSRCSSAASLASRAFNRSTRVVTNNLNDRKRLSRTALCLEVRVV